MSSWTEWPAERGSITGVGIVATVAVHALVLALLVSSRPQITTAPSAVAGVRMLVDLSMSSAPVSTTLKAEPELLRPQVELTMPAFRSDESVATTSSALTRNASASEVQATVQATAATSADALPRFDADYLDNPAPRYPPLSRRQREQGVVWLRVYVLANGLPNTIELKQSSGSKRLDEAALDVVKRWRFVPAKRADQPVASWVVVPISFSLAA